MWDPRFPELAAARLQERQDQAATQAQLAATPGLADAPGLLRRRLGAALMHLGERLAAPPPAAAAGRPAPAAR
jgi:hypothetical protein